MSIESELLSKVHSLLGEGRVGEANTALAQHFDAQPASAPVAGAAAATAAPARAPNDIIIDLLNAIVSHLGTPPMLTTLMDELLAAVGV